MASKETNAPFAGLLKRVRLGQATQRIGSKKTIDTCNGLTVYDRSMTDVDDLLQIYERIKTRQIRFEAVSLILTQRKITQTLNKIFNLAFSVQKVNMFATWAVTPGNILALNLTGMNKEKLN